MRVSIHGLSKSFGLVEALRETHLEIAEREFMSIVGPSGSGKTTLLRLLAGLERPTHGVIAFDGTPVQHLPANKRDIAMVFQNYALYPHMSVEENLGFPLRMGRTPADEIKSRVRETARLLGIDELLGRRPRELSGGQRQRVALGRAIIRRPSLFLLDEPLSNLDPRLRVAMRTEIRRLHGTLKTTFVYVTHDQAEALTMSDRIAVLDRGSVQQVGTPAQVYRAPANRFVAEFIGHPPMTMLSGRIVSDSGRQRFIADALVVELPERFASVRSGPAVLGVRPEDVRVFVAATDGAWKVSVYTREPEGSDLYLTLDANGILVRARVDPEFGVEEGDAVWIQLQPTRLHFFDAASGHALRFDTRDG